MSESIGKRLHTQVYYAIYTCNVCMYIKPAASYLIIIGREFLLSVGISKSIASRHISSLYKYQVQKQKNRREETGKVWILYFRGTWTTGELAVVGVT